MRTRRYFGQEKDEEDEDEEVFWTGELEEAL
jgi:hypothetical protein